MTGAVYRSLGVREREVVAVSIRADGLDDLGGPRTVVTNAADLTVRLLGRCCGLGHGTGVLSEGRGQ